jgi:succinate-semialdehyde dehydrogenase/glutarate-semialdehyde dehydrogenase
MPISINPFNGQEFANVSLISDQEARQKIDLAHQTQKTWKKLPLDEKSRLMNNLIQILSSRKNQFATLISNEMGMPISQSVGEVQKTIDLIDYYKQNAKKFLADKIVKTDAKESYIKYDSLGVLLHIAPWNFPFYLALRPVIPALMAGNTVLLKHSSNVLQTNQILQEIFLEAGFEKGVMQSLLISSSQVEDIIKNPKIAFVTLIGSDTAGMEVAKTAGKVLKKTVMELGGSDAFIVCEDADFNKVFPSATLARLRNCGQSCNAAKRFLVQKNVYKDFLHRLKQEFEEQKYGSPLHTATDIGPLAQEKSLLEVKRQVQESLDMGAKIITGGQGEMAKYSNNWLEFRNQHTSGYFYPATILSNIKPEMPVWKEEVFAPVAPVMSFETIQEAVDLANQSDYGLSVSLWTKDYEKAKSLVSEFETGNVFINSMVRSNIAMPYGGVKKSGYGREMGPEGLLEFVNIKTVVIR